MRRKKKTKSRKPIWEHFGAAVTETEISIQSGINHEISDRRYRWGGALVYKFENYITIVARVIWPEEQVGEEVGFSFYQMDQEKVQLTLNDLHAKNKITGEYRYQKYRGESEPVYETPEPIGLLQKNRKNDMGKQCWFGHATVSPEAITNIMMVLLGHKQTYLHITGTRNGRDINLVRASVSLGDPGDWEEFEKLMARAAAHTDDGKW